MTPPSDSTSFPPQDSSSPVTEIIPLPHNPVIAHPLNIQPPFPHSDVPALDSTVDFPPLSHDPPLCGLIPSPPSPTSSPSFSDPALKKSLPIFTATSPSSPSTLHINSIRFANVTVRKPPKGKQSLKAELSSASPPYIPLSIRIEEADRGFSSRALRALTPPREFTR